MTARALASLVLAGAAFALSACGGAASDPLTPIVCKAMGEAVDKAKTEKPDPATMQMWVVMGIANAAGDEHIRDLGKFVSKSDEATEAACPEARKAVLELTGKPSLQAVIQ